MKVLRLIMSLFSQVVEKYPFTHFMRTLKSVQARDLTNIGGALQRIFAFLHVQRLTLDIDRYGILPLTFLLPLVFCRASTQVFCLPLSNHVGLKDNIIKGKRGLVVVYDAGQGRNPCVNDLTTILLLTDGTELTSLVCQIPCTMTIDGFATMCN